MMETCLICLESTYTYAINNCKCRFNVHEECFNEWIKLYNSCIICKSKIYSKNNKFSVICKYLNKEFEQSKIIYILEYFMNIFFNISNNFENTIIKILFFNCFFGTLFFFMFLPIFIYIIIMSQIKYYYDYIKGNNTLNTLNIFPVYKIRKN